MKMFLTVAQSLFGLILTLFYLGGGGVLAQGESQCLSSMDCLSSQYCRSGVCAKKGDCVSDADCYNPDNRFRGIRCPGPIYCGIATKTCRRRCVFTSNRCPPDQPRPESCTVLPCDRLPSSCTSTEDVTHCYNYVCGECTGHAYNRGKLVCEVV